MERLTLRLPTQRDEQAVLDYRVEHFAAGERTLHGTALLDSKVRERQMMEKIAQQY